MNNIIFCTDKIYFKFIPYVLNTFKKFHNLEKYKFYFILYDINENIHNELIEILQNISNNINYKYNYFKPSDEFIQLLSLYLETINKPSFLEGKEIFKNLANWSRFFINKIFPEIKLGLYLDLDILFNSNIDDLFKLNISEYPIASVPYLYKNTKHNNNKTIYELINPNYREQTIKELKFNLEDLKENLIYNCGVILINFELYNKINVLSSLLNYFKYIVKIKKRFHKPSGTQNIFNLLFPKYYKLNYSYNYILKYYKYNNIEEMNILHFKGYGNSCNKRYKNIYNKIIES